MVDQYAMPALRAWLDDAFTGNLDAGEWAVTTVADASAAIGGIAAYSGAWRDTRSRAELSLSSPPVAIQQEAALRDGSAMEWLSAAVRSDPESWLVPGTDRPLDALCFAHSATETCDTCSGKGDVQCRPCGGNGRTTCSPCSGSGSVRTSCGGCGGSGRSARTRQVRFVNGSIVDTRNETYYVTCLACGGPGWTPMSCGGCNGRGTVQCGTCQGRTRVRCDDCVGAGQRDYRYDRRFLVTATVSLAIGDAVEAEQGRALLLAEWTTLARSGEAGLSHIDVRHADGDTVEIGFRAAPQWAIGDVTARAAEGRIWCFGHSAPIRAADPILARAWALEGDHSPGGWAELALELSGRRLLTEAAQVAALQRGPTDARREGTAGALLKDYGALLGEAGAHALAHVAQAGVGRLRGVARWRIWRLGIAASTGLGLVVAALIMILIGRATGREPQYAALRMPAQVFRYALYVAVVSIAVAQIVAVRRVKAVEQQLGLSGTAGPTNLRRALAWPAASLAAFLALAGGLPWLSYATRLPAGFRIAVDRALMPPILPVVAAVTTIQLRSQPSESAPSLRTLRPGTQLRVIEDDVGSGWTKVRWNMGYGFVATRYVRPVPAALITIP